LICKTLQDIDETLIYAYFHASQTS